MMLSLDFNKLNKKVTKIQTITILKELLKTL